MNTIALLVSFIALLVIVRCEGEAVLSSLVSLLKAGFSARRPRTFADWDIAMDDSEDKGMGWPVALTREATPSFAPPVHFVDFLASLDDAPALEVAARFLDLRRELFGPASEEDESLYLVEMACFVSLDWRDGYLSGHAEGAERRDDSVGCDTPMATPQAREIVRSTLAMGVSAYAETMAI